MIAPSTVGRARVVRMNSTSARRVTLARVKPNSSSKSHNKQVQQVKKVATGSAAAAMLASTMVASAPAMAAVNEVGQVAGAEFMPSILVPLVGLFFPIVTMASIFLYIEEEQIS